MSLEQFDSQFNARDAGRVPAGLETLPDGDYSLEIVRADLQTTKKTGETILRWFYRVLDGAQAGQQVEATAFFRTLANVNNVGADLELLGHSTADWTAANGKPFSKMLPQVLPLLVGIKFRGRKESTPGANGRTFPNLRILARSAAPAAMPAGPATAPSFQATGAITFLGGDPLPF